MNFLYRTLDISKRDPVQYHFFNIIFYLCRQRLGSDPAGPVGALRVQTRHWVHCCTCSLENLIL